MPKWACHPTRKVGDSGFSSESVKAGFELVTSVHTNLHERHQANQSSGELRWSAMTNHISAGRSSMCILITDVERTRDKVTCFECTSRALVSLFEVPYQLVWIVHYPLFV